MLIQTHRTKQRQLLPLLAMAFRGFDPAYAIVSWLCWVPNLAVAEMIVRRTTAPLLPRAG